MAMQGLRLYRAGMLWYRLTQRLSGRRERDDVTVHGTVDEIVAAFAGGVYKRDPLKGKLDIMEHPGVVQRRMNRNEKLGDCDAFASLWCAKLVKSALAKDVYFCTIQMRRGKDKVGHAFAAFRTDAGLQWVDYGAPHVCTDWSHVLRTVAIMFDATPVGMTWVRIPKLAADDALVFDMRVAGRLFA